MMDSNKTSQDDAPHDELRVLVAEDEIQVGNLLVDIISTEGYKADLVHNGLEAMDRLKVQPYDVVVTDYSMPGANGLTVLREAIRLYPKIMVAIITGYASVQDAIQAVDEGAYYYLRKPFHLDEIRVMIRRIADRIALTRENERLERELRQTVEQLRVCLGGEEVGDRLPVAGEAAAGVGPALWSQSLPPSYYHHRVPKEGGLLTDLERIVGLRKEGLLTEEEFVALKKTLIESLEEPY